MPNHGHIYSTALKMAGVTKELSLTTSVEPAIRELARQQARQSIEDYRNGLVPLIVPMTLFSYFAERYGIEYLVRQSYLNPHPKELMLRNHV